MAIKFPNPVSTSIEKTRKEVCQLTGELITNEEIIKRLAKERGNTEDATLSLYLTEHWWITRKRPFFNIHPPVINGLANTPLSLKPNSIPKSVVHELGTICIKFPCGFRHKLLKDVTHFYLTCANIRFDPITMKEIKQDTVGIFYSDSVASFNTYTPADETFESITDSALAGEDQTEFEIQQRNFITRLALGVMLLAADSAFIEPVLLRRDFGRIGDRDVMAERARRNGVIGYEIGSNMEVSPHFRRPHFAIRWTGKGAEVPRLVPVKGAVIHRSQLEVPTGYEADDD